MVLYNSLDADIWQASVYITKQNIIAKRKKHLFSVYLFCHPSL